jgi:hypothetical protein
MEALRLDWIKQLGTELKSYMRRIFMSNVETYRAVIPIQGSLSNDRLLIREPFILEDAVGRIFPSTCSSSTPGHAFQAVLCLHFQGIQGLTKVQRGEYVLQEH